MNQLRQLTVCAAALLAATGAQAQLTLYGRANINFEKTSLGGTPAADAFGGNQRVSSNSSRIGLRAAKEIEGVKLFAQVESAVNVDAGGDVLASRDTFAGVEAGFGKLRLGKMDSPWKELGGLTDRFKGTGAQDEGSIAALGGSNNGFGRRQNNSLRYDSPTFAGARGSLQYGLDTEDRNSAQQKRVLSASMHYQVSKVQLAAAYQKHYNFNAVDFDDDAWRLGANVDFGFVNIGAGFNRLHYRLAAGSVSRKYATVTASVPVGNGAINVRAGKAGGVGGSAPAGTLVAGADGAELFVGPDSGARQFTIGYEHTLFKGAQAYAYWTKVSNQANANYRFGVNALNVAAAGRGADPSAFVIGMLYDF